MVAATLASGSLYQAGCGDTGYYDYGYSDYGYSDYGYYGGYGPIDDDVFQNAADAWSDYIRG
jgi:hypothetical protein